MASSSDLRKGMAINHKGELAVVLDAMHRTPGNLRAFVQVHLRNIRTGKSYETRFSTSEKIEIVPMFNKKLEFSYKDREEYVFCDPETYEMLPIHEDVIGDDKDYLVENCEVNVTFVNDRAVLVELPASVTMKVIEAPEGLKGDSASNVQKAIIVETGISIQAPLFIKPQEKIRVDTRTGKYMERVND